MGRRRTDDSIYIEVGIPLRWAWELKSKNTACRGRVCGLPFDKHICQLASWIGEKYLLPRAPSRSKFLDLYGSHSSCF